MLRKVETNVKSLREGDRIVGNFTSQRQRDVLAVTHEARLLTASSPTAAARLSVLVLRDPQRSSFRTDVTETIVMDGNELVTLELEEPHGASLG